MLQGWTLAAWPECSRCTPRQHSSMLVSSCINMAAVRAVMRPQSAKVGKNNEISKDMFPAKTKSWFILYGEKGLGFIKPFFAKFY